MWLITGHMPCRGVNSYYPCLLVFPFLFSNYFLTISYSIFSLESDALVKASPKLNVVGCAESLTCTGNLVQTEESKQKVSEKGIHESEGTEGRPDGAAAENLGGLSLNSGDSDTAGRDILIEEGSSRHNLLPDTLLDKNLHNSPVADRSELGATKCTQFIQAPSLKP